MNRRTALPIREPDYTRNARREVEQRWLHHAQGCRVCGQGDIHTFKGPIAPDCPDGRKLYNEWRSLWRHRKPMHAN